MAIYLLYAALRPASVTKKFRFGCVAVVTYIEVGYTAFQRNLKSLVPWQFDQLNLTKKTFLKYYFGTVPLWRASVCDISFQLPNPISAPSVVPCLGCRHQQPLLAAMCRPTKVSIHFISV